MASQKSAGQLKALPEVCRSEVTARLGSLKVLLLRRIDRFPDGFPLETSCFHWGSTMPTFHPLLAAWFRGHHGVVSRRQLLSLDVTPAQLKAMLRCGELSVVWEGVYRHVLWPETKLSRCAALCAADPSLVVSCGGGALIWGYRRCAHVDVHVSGTGPGRRFSGGPVHHRCPINCRTGTLHCRNDGIRVTSPARTIFDLVQASSGQRHREHHRAGHPAVAVRHSNSLTRWVKAFVVEAVLAQQRLRRSCRRARRGVDPLIRIRSSFCATH